MLLDFGEDPNYKEYYENEVKNSQLESICDSNNLYRASQDCLKGVSWKHSVQQNDMNILTNIRTTQKAIRNGTYKEKPVVEFKLNERGHIRDIKSHDIRDRNVQRSLNDNVLMPRVKNSLIYNNGASIKGKGISFTRKQFKFDLLNAKQEYGDSCYILLIDFSKYFDNIRHQETLNMLQPYLNQAEYDFVSSLFKEFEVDVSYMSDEEYACCMDTLFNSLDYASNIPKELRTGAKFMPKSIGIGSHLSQICGIYYPHQIDNYCKTVLGLKYYGRYMDDTYIIANSKEYLQWVLQQITIIANQLGIFINQKKTRILDVNKSIITYLKINYFFDPNTGKLIEKINSETIRRERRRLRKFYDLMNIGIIRYEDIRNWFLSWLGTYDKFDSGYELLNIKKYFMQLFNVNSYLLKEEDMIKIPMDPSASRLEFKEIPRKDVVKKSHKPQYNTYRMIPGYNC